jgi:hypothetical protein
MSRFATSRLLKKSPTVIPGRNEGANPESSHADLLRISGFRIAACAASGMTTEIFQQPARAFPLLTESEAGPYDSDSTRFLHANRFPLRLKTL